MTERDKANLGGGLDTFKQTLFLNVLTCIDLMVNAVEITKFTIIRNQGNENFTFSHVITFLTILKFSKQTNKHFATCLVLRYMYLLYSSCILQFKVHFGNRL